ncbi:hypothetical protein GCM10027062_07120 [Nocardioides hungaricus]
MLVLAVLAFAAPAVASGGNSGNFARPLTNSDSSAELRAGSWQFDRWPNGPQFPGFNYYGNLKDLKADGDWVYTRGKVDGYDWGGGASAENHDGADAPAKPIAQKVWGADPPGQGKIQVCRHRSGVIPNICVESDWKYPA